MNKYKATVYTAATHGDVSIATFIVSRIVDGSLNVAPEICPRVMQAMEELNTAFSQFA